MFSISEDEISCFKINEIENDFIKNLWHHDFILFLYCNIQETNQNTNIETSSEINFFI
jgi:hypothetical protein